MRGKQVAGHPGVVAAVITHLPDEEGYHERRFEVIRFSLESLRAGAPGVPVLVWDNGSCARLLDWLRDEYRPDYLVLSPNVGKVNARTSIWGMFPGGTVIAAADDDIGYKPGWLDEQIKLLRHFPDVGAVSGYVARTAFRWGIWNTLEWGRENAQVESGRFLPDEYEVQFAESVGRTVKEQREYTADDKDYRVTYKGVQAYCTASHCQFVGYQDRLAPLMKWSHAAMPEERSFDEAIDKAGLLRLGTIERTTWHLGNVLTKG
jgi:hypothetical protein